MTPETFQQTYRQALAVLDAQIARVNRQLATLATARKGDPDAISASIAAAQQAADTLASTVAEAAGKVGDPLPRWDSREELDAVVGRLVERLKALGVATRRSRLQDIAASLLVAQVLHPKWRKVVPALEALRLRAVAQVQEAATAVDPPELPGPTDGGAWLAWAWDLPPEQVEESLAAVRAVVPALAEVVLEIDPGHWVVVIAEAIAVPEPATPVPEHQREGAKTQPAAEAPTPSAAEVVPLAEAAPPQTPPAAVLPNISWLEEESPVGDQPGTEPESSSIMPTRPRPKNVPRSPNDRMKRRTD